MFTVTPIPNQYAVNGTMFPLALTPTPGATDRSFPTLVKHVHQEREYILNLCKIHGAVLLRGFTEDSAEEFALEAEALNLVKYPYVGGAAPRTDVVRDVVFTTNESPPSEPIPFHHEIAQVPDPPSYIMFYCDVEPFKGGETPIIRSDQVAEFFFQTYPEFAAEVEEKGVKYIRVMPKEDDNSSAIGRSWKSTFQCTTKEEAETAMKKIGTTWEWLENGDLRTISAAVPAIRTDRRSGRKMFFNSMVAAYTGWIDSRNDPTKSIVLGDDTAVNGEALLKVAEFQRDNRVCFQWKKGDIIVIDNFVTMHSRNTFERPRRILAAIGGPSLDGFATGSGIRQAESTVGEDIPAPTSPVGTDPLPAPASGQRRFNPTTTNARASQVPMQTLARTGDSMPVLGLGMWKVPNDATAQCVVDAIEAGWRHFDCACDYGNEQEVGEGIRQAISSGLVTREELWITSKLWNTYHNPEHVAQACQKSLTDLGLEYLDLYLIHFPISLKFVPFEERYPPEWVHDPKGENPRMEFANEPMYKTWGAMEDLVDAQMVRNIGMCNIGMCVLSDMLSYARYAPQVLQVELHPYNTQEKLTRYCNDKNIYVTGFSPLGAGSYVELNMATTNQSTLLEQSVVDLSVKYKCTPGQIVLKWGVQCGRCVIPKTTKKHRLIENIELFTFELTEEDMQLVNQLNKNMRFNDPGEFCQGMGAFCPIYN